MKLPSTINLLMIDDNQLYAEQLIALLETHFYQKVTLGFLDDKEELLKSLRQSWDVLVMGKAYDLTLPQVIGILAEQHLDLPVISLLDKDFDPSTLTGLNANEQTLLTLIDPNDSSPTSLPLYRHWGAITALPKDRLYELAASIYQEHQNLITRKQLKELRQVLSDAEQRSNILIKNSKSAVAYIEEGLHIYANDPYLQMFGYQSMEDIMGIPVVDLIASNNIKDFKQFLRDFERGNRENVEFKFESVKTDGSTFAAKLQLAAATYEGQPCLQVIIQPNEQGNSAELAKKLAQMERIDVLTGIANRRGFETTLETVRTQAIAQKNQSGLLHIRIDNIGKINSSLGVQGVDSTVIAITELLTERTQALLANQNIDISQVKQGYVSRFSDASFMVILPNIDQATLTTWSQTLMADIAEHLIEIGNRTVKVTISIGATMLTASSPDVTDLTNRVIEAANIVRTNTNGEGNDFYLYDPSQFANSDDGALLEALRAALEQGKFQLLYQPVYDIKQDISNLFEVYLRLPLADGTLMTPDKFMDVAEKHNLLEKIDRWVLIRACKALKEYRQTDPSARLLIQLSAKSLTDNTLPAFASQLIRAVGGNSEHTLTFQFNETILTDYLAMATKQAEQLKTVQCDIGIHNFGSAVNAIEILDMIKPTVVRLDRSYVKDLGNSDNVDTIKTLITQVNGHASDALMPYIEDAASMSAAWTVGARYLQGDYLQAPSPQMQIQTEAA